MQVPSDSEIATLKPILIDWSARELVVSCILWRRRQLVSSVATTSDLFTSCCTEHPLPSLLILGFGIFKERRVTVSDEAGAHVSWKVSDPPGGLRSQTTVSPCVLFRLQDI